MTEWKTYRLGDVISIKSGFAYKGEYLGKGDKYLLGMGCVSFNEKFLPSGARLYAGDVPSRYFVKAGDIVLATRQQSDNLPILGMPAIIPSTYKNTFVGANLYAIQNDSDIDNNYLYWLLRTPEYIQHIKSCQTGTTVRMITKSNIESFEFKCPNRIERNRISNLLWSLENKIENNRRINANLELQAQALYKQWFVDFEFPNEKGKPYKSSGGKMVDSDLGPIPEGWSVGTLSDLADVTMGQSPNGKSFNENGDGIVFYQGRTEFGVRYPSIRLYTTEPTRYAEPMSILLSVRAPVGDINIATQRCCIGRGIASIKSKTDDNAYMYCCLKELRPQLDQYNGEGTVFGSINRKELEGLALCIPKNEVISQFNNLVLGMDRQMLNLFQQTQNLAILRDTLLPKLMNGEIKL